MADLDDLRAFVLAARAGSFASAARNLGVTPALVGRRVQTLEQRYGTRLVERTTRAQRLTQAGETLLTKAQAVLDASAELEDSMRAGPGELEGRIRMTGPATLGVFALADLVSRFQTANPAVTVEMVLSDRRLDLFTDDLDFAVRIGELQSSSLIARHIGTYRLAVVASPAFLALHGNPKVPSDFGGARCIINLNMSPRNRWPFSHAGRTEIVEVRGGLQIDSGEAIRVATLQGAGFSYMPIDLVRDDLTEGRLVRVLPAWEMHQLPIYLVYPSRRVARRTAVLMDLLAAELVVSHPL